MNLYEHTIIARPDVSPNQVKQLLDKYTKIVEKFDKSFKFDGKQGSFVGKLIGEKWLKHQEKEFNKRVALYKRANNAVKQKDWAKLKDIATTLDIDLTYDEIDDILYLEETTKSLAEKIKELMSTYAWAWAHVQEQNRELLRQQILKTFKNE